MSGSTDSPLKFELPINFGQYAAMYLTVAAFSLATLATQQSMWANGAVLPYILGVLLFAFLARWSLHHLDAPLKSTLPVLIAHAVLICGLTVLSGYYFITSMLAFVTVSLSQACLSQRGAVVFDAVLLGALALMYALGLRPAAALQIALGIGAGFVFVALFTRLALSEVRAHEQLEQANRQLDSYAAQVEQLATMRERTRLAREVHDSLGHYLTVISVQLEVVEKLVDSNPARAKEAAGKARGLAAEGLSEVRRSIAALRPSPLEDRPLPEAIGALIEASRDAGLIVTFEQSGAPCSLSSELETVLYRAAQEALTNIRKHAHASAASVRLAYQAGTVDLRIRDNGVGRRGREDHVGLSALRQRIAALNGAVIAENHLEGGFLVEVTLPIGKT